ncbi:MAG: flagellar basal body-associated FliL family protein [Moorellaceae bacterium]
MIIFGKKKGVNGVLDKGTKVLAVIIVGAMLVSSVLLGGCSFVGGKAEASPKKDITLKLDSIVTNLADRGRYVRTTVVLSFPSPEGMKKAEDRTAALRDAIIMTLRKKTVEDLADTSKLKKDLLEAVNRALEPASVEASKVWLEDLITQ